MADGQKEGEKRGKDRHNEHSHFLEDTKPGNGDLIWRIT